MKNRFPDIEERKLLWVSDNHKISCCHKNHLNTSQKNFAANNPFLLIILSKVETWNRLIFYLGVESFVWSVSSMRVFLLASFILLGQLSLLIMIRIDRLTLALSKRNSLTPTHPKFKSFLLKVDQPQPLFHLFLSFRSENFSSQEDSNLDHRNWRWGRWPLDRSPRHRPKLL